MASFAIGKDCQYTVQVSDCDLEFITRWRWCPKISNKKWGYAVHARRRTTLGSRERNVTILLSHFILEKRMRQPRPSLDHDADHIDGETLNNTRENLRWLHKSKNRKRKTPRRVKYFDRRRGHSRDVPIFL